MISKVEYVHSQTTRSSKVTPSRNHGKSPMTETYFYSISYVMHTSSIPPQTSPLSYIPFGTINTPHPRSSSVSKTIIISRPFVYVTLSIPNPTLFESTTTTTIPPLTLNTCTTYKTTPNLLIQKAIHLTLTFPHPLL